MWLISLASTGASHKGQRRHTHPDLAVSARIIYYIAAAATRYAAATAGTRAGCKLRLDHFGMSYFHATHKAPIWNRFSRARRRGCSLCEKNRVKRPLFYFYSWFVSFVWYQQVALNVVHWDKAGERKIGFLRVSASEITVLFWASSIFRCQKIYYLISNAARRTKRGKFSGHWYQSAYKSIKMYARKIIQN